MNSYQKLKLRCDDLQRQLNIFKDCLTVCRKEPKLVYEAELENGTLFNYEQLVAVAFQKKLDELAKNELTRWVAFNLDKESVLHLLKIKEELKNAE